MNIDKFSQKQSKLTDITSELANEIKLVLKSYNESLKIDAIKLIGRLEDIKNDSNSVNFKINLKNKNILLLKKISESKHDSNSMIKMTKLISWCEKNKISMPGLHFTLSNEPFLLFNKHYWILMEFLEGTYFKGSIKQLRQSASDFGFMTKKISNLPKSLIPIKSKKPYFEKKEAKIYENLSNSRVYWDSILGKSTANRLKNNWKILDCIWKDLNQTNYLLKKYSYPIHHDLHPHNLIFNKKKAFILDHDSLILGSVQSAIGFSILKLLKYMHDYNYKKNFESKSNEFFNIWITAFSEHFPNKFKKEEILKFGKAEIFRRFLSMIDKAYKKIPSSFNGPKVHLDTLLVAEKI